MPANFVTGLPAPGEYPPFAEGYVAKARSVTDPERGMQDQLDAMLPVLRQLTRAQRAHRYAPGKWTIQEMLGHIVDTERIFAARLLRIARGDETPLPPFEQDDYVNGAQAAQCDWDSLLSEFEHLRRSNILMVRNFPEAAWSRRGTVSGHPVSARGLAYLLIGHVAAHLEILRERYL